MSFRRRAGGGKRDLAEAAIVQALEAAGVQTWQLSGTGNPDLLCFTRGAFFALEVKTEKGKRTRNQTTIPWPIVRTPEEALAAVMNTHVAAKLRSARRGPSREPTAVSRDTQTVGRSR
jgi:hypothetical protein